MPKQVAIWIDHGEAHVVTFMDPDKPEVATIAARRRIHDKHPKGPEGVHQHPDDAVRFYRTVARSLEGADAILVVGPSTAKLEFLRYLHKHDHAIEPKVIGMETVDHPTDPQLVAYAKAYFDRSDRNVLGPDPMVSPGVQEREAEEPAERSGRRPNVKAAPRSPHAPLGAPALEHETSPAKALVR
jgi:hypothetical protein